jgi:hypothetical protein
MLKISADKFLILNDVSFDFERDPDPVCNFYLFCTGSLLFANYYCLSLLILNVIRILSPKVTFRLGLFSDNFILLLNLVHGFSSYFALFSV